MDTPAPEPPALEEDATCPTHHLPSPSNSKPVLVVMNKSRPLIPLLQMA
jgi:hypothetical protein